MNRRKKNSDIDTGRMATAYHEAGHAVMALAVGRPVEKVTIIAAALQTGGSRLGACKVQKGRSKASKDGLEDEAMILLAGMVGESHFTRRYSPDGAAQDLRMAQRLLSDRAGSERQLERLLTRVLKKRNTCWPRRCMWMRLPALPPSCTKKRRSADGLCGN